MNNAVNVSYQALKRTLECNQGMEVSFIPFDTHYQLFAYRSSGAFCITCAILMDGGEDQLDFENRFVTPTATP